MIWLCILLLEIRFIRCVVLLVDFSCVVNLRIVWFLKNELFLIVRLIWLRFIVIM